MIQRGNNREYIFQDDQVHWNSIISQLADQNPIKTICRKSLDEILKDTGVDEESFKLIKRVQGKRILTEYKLLYVKEALKLNYTLKAIGDNIKISNVAVLDMINRHNLII